MRRTVQIAAGLTLFLMFAQTGWAADDEAVKIIDKAIKAHFPKGLDLKKTGVHTKGKGTLHIGGMDLEFTNETAVQIPNKFKEAMTLTVMGQTVNVTTVYNGKEGWIRTQNMDVKVTDDILTELKDAAYSMGVMQGVFLKDKSVKFSLIGDAKVDGKATVGVTVSREGNKDINLFFDKETGLIAKVEMRKKDLMSGEEVNEERIMKEYQEVDGRKVAKKVDVLRGGKPFIELEVTEMKIVEKVDDGEFVQPK